MDQAEYLDWETEQHPGQSRIVIGLAGAVVGALAVALGPGLVTNSTADPSAQRPHTHTVTTKTGCTMSTCRRENVQRWPSSDPDGNSRGGGNFTALAHEGCR